MHVADLVVNNSSMYVSFFVLFDLVILYPNITTNHNILSVKTKGFSSHLVHLNPPMHNRLQARLHLQPVQRTKSPPSIFFSYLFHSDVS